MKIKIFNQFAVLLAYILGVVYTNVGIRELKWYYYLPILMGTYIVLFIINDLLHKENH